MEKLIITPKTNIYDLLEAYPQLEDVLIESAPQFKKLKNPVLRNTIAKIATLNQAAAIGSLKVEDLVNKLRKPVGQDGIAVIDNNNSRINTTCPDWFKNEDIIYTINIREIFRNDEQPIHEILSAIKKLNMGEILKIIAPFLPAPLIDKSLSLDYKHWAEQRSENIFHVYFTK